MKKLWLIGLLVGMPLAAQVPGQRYPLLTELGAGAGLDILARGPWIAKPWRQSFTGRVILAIGVSAIYEYAVEPWNGMANAGSGRDFRQRLYGTLLCEGVVWLGRKLF